MPQLALAAAVTMPVADISRQLLGATFLARWWAFQALIAAGSTWPVAGVVTMRRSSSEQPRPGQGDTTAGNAAVQECPHLVQEGGRTYQVRVLGPVTVAGVSRPSGAVGRARELVALLAVSDGHRATRDRLRDRLGAGADRPMVDGYFRQTCSRARALLGIANDGRPQLLYDQDVYALHPDVTIDWDDFQALTARAKTHSPDPVADLRRALSLVRGEPLEDCGYRWLDPMVIEQVRARIVQTAALLADLSRDDPYTAAWAACHGLLADPYAEPLYRTLMTTSHTLGHTRALHLAYQLCEQALDTLDLTPHEQTTTLYHDLTQTRPAQRLKQSDHPTDPNTQGRQP